MLIMIGATLATMRAVSLTRAVVFSAARATAGVAIGAFVAFYLELPPVAKRVLILQCAMPVAVLSYVFAQRWNNQPEEIAGLVVVSTWSAVLTVPIVLRLIL